MSETLRDAPKSDGFLTTLLHSCDMASTHVTNVWMDLAFAYGDMIRDAATVVTIRSGAMATGRMTGAEAREMVIEKPFAFAASIQSATLAVMHGGSPAWVAQNALAPIGRATSDNARRLIGRI